MAAALGKRFRSECDRNPESDIALEELKSGRHHANHGVFFVVEENILPDNVARAAEASLPQSMAEDGDSICAGLILIRQKNAAEGGLHAQQWKEIGRHAVSLDFFRLTIAD